MTRPQNSDVNEVRARQIESLQFDANESWTIPWTGVITGGLKNMWFTWQPGLSSRWDAHRTFWTLLSRIEVVLELSWALLSAAIGRGRKNTWFTQKSGLSSWWDSWKLSVRYSICASSREEARILGELPIFPSTTAGSHWHIFWNSI